VFVVDVHVLSTNHPGLLMRITETDSFADKKLATSLAVSSRL